MQFTWDETLIAELRANLQDVCGVRDELYMALERRANDVASLRQQIATLSAQVAQRDARIAELEDENVTLLRALKGAQSALDALFGEPTVDAAIDEAFGLGALAFDMARNDVRAVVNEVGALPFEEKPAPENPDAPAEFDLSIESTSTEYKPNCITCGKSMRKGQHMRLGTEHFQEWFCPVHGGYWAND